MDSGRFQGDASRTAKRDERAVAREVREETGLEVVIGDELGAVDVPGHGQVEYAVRDFRCTVVGGSLRAGDDAANVEWFTEEQVLELPTTPGLIDYLREWGVFKT